MSGSSNVVADALSRPAIPLDLCDDTPAFFGDSLGGSVSLCPGLDLAALAGAQSAPDAVLEFASLRSSSSLDLRDVPHSTGTTLLCDVSQGSPRPLVPWEWVPRVFSGFHGISHAKKQPDSVRG